MTGTIGLNPPGYLPSLFGSASQGASLLAALHGYAGAAPTRADPMAALDEARAGETNQVALVSADPHVKSDIARFMATLATAKTPAQLLANPTALKVLLTANGLRDQAANTGLAMKALLADQTQPGSLINQLSDSRWLRVNKTYEFASKGLAVLKHPNSVAAVTDGFTEVLWRDKLDQATPGLSNALDFLKRAPAISNADQVLDAPALRIVVTAALGVPKEIAFQPRAAQRHALSSRVDLTKFQDAAFVRQFTEIYLNAARKAASLMSGTAQSESSTRSALSAGLVV